METTLDYLERMHEFMIDDYTKPKKGGIKAHCGLIAYDIARKLLNDGKQPVIIQVLGKIIDDVGNRKAIFPKQLKEISWGGHQACLVEGLVYDPMIGKPLKLEDYFDIAFEGEVEYQVVIPFSEIEEFVKR